MRQSSSALREAFSAALIPPSWRSRNPFRFPPWTARCHSAERSDPTPEHSTPQRPSADFQERGSRVQTAPPDARPTYGWTAPFQTHFYSDAFCPAWPGPAHAFDPAPEILRPPLTLILAHHYKKRLCRSCLSLPLPAERNTPALPAQRQIL